MKRRTFLRTILTALILGGIGFYSLPPGAFDISASPRSPGARTSWSSDVANNSSVAAAPTTRSSDVERDVAIGERQLNASNLVSIDERFVGPLKVPLLLAPNRRSLSPVTITLLDLDEGERTGVAEAIAAAERDLKDTLNARAALKPVKDGVQLSYHLGPEEIATRESELRRQIARGLDPDSQRYFQKIADGALLSNLLPVRLGDIAVTITRREDGHYRVEMVGQEASGNHRTAWWVGNAEAVVTEFYGPQARTLLPQIEDDLDAVRARRRGPAKR
jgi:hypothetical protein